MIEKILKLPTMNDLPIIVKMAKKFHGSSPYSSISFDREKIRRFAINVINGTKENEIIILGLVNNQIVGMVAGVATPTIFSNEKVAYEVGWWVDPEYRKNRVGVFLYKAYEDWAKRVGCVAVNCAYIDKNMNDKTHKEFFESLGYSSSEHAYIKEIR